MEEAMTSTTEVVPAGEALPADDGEQEAGRSRRDLFRILGAAAAGAVAGGVLSAKEAEAHGTFHQDSGNTTPAIHGNNTDNGPGVKGDSVTGAGVQGSTDTGIAVFASTAGDGTGVFGQVLSTEPAVRGQNFGSGIGVLGQSTDGHGVSGETNQAGRAGVIGANASTSFSALGVEGSVDGSGRGVFGHSALGRGVHGHSNGDGAGVMGDITSDIGSGVLGLNNGSGPGVKGLSDGTGVRGEGGVGVSGSSPTGVGVLGEGDNGIGVYASSNSFIALYVQGPATFSTAGSGIIPANQNSVFVSNPAVTAQSHITVTLTGDPATVSVKGGSGTSAIMWVERQPGTGFVVHLTSRVGAATPLTYLIVEPG
jgi:hypothetical protein